MVLSRYGLNWRELRKNTYAALNTDAVKQYYHVQEDYVDTLDESGKPIVPNSEFVSGLARFVSVRFSDGLLSDTLLFSFAAHSRSTSAHVLLRLCLSSGTLRQTTE
jgi:hypothetical protein